MARYSSDSYSRQKAQRWIYIISVLLIIAVVVVFAVRRHKSRPLKEPTAPVAGRTAEKAAPTNLSEAKVEPQSFPSGIIGSVPEAVSEPNARVDELIAGAVACIGANPPRIIEARDRLNEILPMPMSDRQRAVVKERLSELAEKWLFSRKIYPQDKICGSYKVEQGDLLSNIGKRNKVPYEILAQINGLNRPEALQAGETIKIINGPFHVRLYRSTFTMDLYLQNTFVRSFPVGLGKPGMETPTGLWRVKLDGKLIAPTWTDPITGKTYQASDPDYPLGSRWIGLEGLDGAARGRTGFAIHGTKDPNQIGTASSQGCIRLHNGNAILVYSLLAPGLSLVEVVD